MADNFDLTTDAGAGEAADSSEPLTQAETNDFQPEAATESGLAALEDYFIAQEEGGNAGRDEAGERTGRLSGERETAESDDEGEEAAGEAAAHREASGDESPEAEPAEAPTLESLNEKYPRQNKKLLAETVGYAEAARRGREAIENLGGESLLAPLGKISNGMRTGETREVFEGLLEGASEDDLLRLVGDAAWLALGHSRQMKEAPESAALGRRLEALGDQIIAHRMGGDYTLQKLEMLKDLDQVGWLDALDDWKTQGYVDPDQFFELLEAEEEPEIFNRLRGEIKEKDRQLEQTKIQQQREREEKAKAADAEFVRSSAESLEKVLNETVWAKSVLRELKGDGRELAEEKSFLRGQLLDEAKRAFESGQGLGSLKASFRSGAGSKVYRDALTGAINDAVLQTKDQTAIAERILSKLYAGTRNGSLTRPAAARDRPTGGTPTKTTEFSPQKPLNEKEIQRNLEEAFRVRG